MSARKPFVVGRLSHVALGAGDDVEALINFYGALFGVVEVGRDGDTVYLAGGRKPGYDLALVPGPAGLDHFAMQMGGEADLDAAVEELSGAGVAVEELDVAGEPGLARGARFVAPSGHVVELVTLSDPVAFPGTPAIDARHFRGVGPVELEHVSINCDDVEATAGFLVDRLGFAITDYSHHGDDPWFLAFLRCRDIHHDIGMFHDPEWKGPGLNHLAFVVPSIAELARVSDLAFGLGIALQCSPGRHLVGDNMFVYLADPSGNRVEVSTPAARIDPAAPPKEFDAASDAEWHGFDAWRTGIPPAARWPSPSRDGRTAAAGGREAAA